MQGNIAVPRVLIQRGKEDTAKTKWEDYIEMKNSYPELNLEDKVTFK